MKHLLEKTVTIVLSLIVAGSAFALGLGNSSGQAILGQSLLIEIPLLGSEDGIPAVECFKVRPPMAEIESSFVLRNAQLRVVAERGRAKLIVASPSPVREPVVEFGVTIGCGFEISKDYLLLTAEPAKIVLPPEAIKLPAQTPVESQSNLAASAKPAKSTLPAIPADEFLRVEGAVTLKQLAQQIYPLQPKAREKFIRMMTQANPNLKQGDTQITTETELRVPSGLPLRRQGAYHPLAKSVAVAGQSTVKPVIVSPTKHPAVAAKPHQDLLVLGAPAQKNAAELLAEAERLTAILMEQTEAQSAASEKIAQLEGSLNDLKKHVSGLENRINAIEVARQAEKSAAKPASLDFLELLLAVLAGGAIGGLTLHFYNRLQFRRTPGPHKRQPEGLPWEKSHEPVGMKAAKGANTDSPTLAKKKLAEETFEPAKQPPSPQNDFDFVERLSR
ncbi:MAG: hypothetical protein WC073_09660 [Sterolibacterium sp.]